MFPELPEPLYFNPCDFAGYLEISESQHNELERIRRKDGKKVTPEEVGFVLSCNAYTKKTGLWGEFNHNIRKRRIEPVKLCNQGTFTQRLGGRSERTKALRSVTPLGFAKAFYEANKDYRHIEDYSHQLYIDF